MTTTRPPGRPAYPPEQRRSRKLDLRLKPEEHEQLARAANLAHASIGEWARAVLLRAARRRSRAR